MVGATRFGHELKHRAVFRDDVVGRDLGHGIAEPQQGGGAVRHAGIMQHEAVGSDVAAAPLRMVWRRQHTADEPAVGRRIHALLVAGKRRDPEADGLAIFVEAALEAATLAGAGADLLDRRRR